MIRRLGAGFVVRKRITSVVKIGEIVRNKTLCTVLSGFLCFIAVRKARLRVEDILLLIIFCKESRL